jgi:hypothetical protein
MMKKITAVIMALLLAMSFASVAFAEDAGSEADYVYSMDSSLLPIETDYANGNIVNKAITTINTDGSTTTEIEKDEDGSPKVYLGQQASAMFQVVTKKVYALNKVPTTVIETPQTNEDGTPVIDETTGEQKVTKTTYSVKEGGESGQSAIYDGIIISVYYAVKCPKCHGATGGKTFYDIYSANKGYCAHCGYKFPAPTDESMKFYRFIGIDEDSSYYKVFKDYDFTEYAKDVFGDTAKYYGDGVDLPQQYLTYTDVYDDTITGDNKYVNTLTDFKTSGETSNGTKAKLYVFLVDLGYWAEPITEFLSVSKFIQFRANVRNVWYSFIDTIVTAPFTKWL